MFFEIGSRSYSSNYFGGKRGPTLEGSAQKKNSSLKKKNSIALFNHDYGFSIKKGYHWPGKEKSVFHYREVMVIK